MGSVREKVAQKQSRSEAIPLKNWLAVTRGLRVPRSARRLLSHHLQVDATVKDDETGERPVMSLMWLAVEPSKLWQPVRHALTQWASRSTTAKPSSSLCRTVP